MLLNDGEPYRVERQDCITHMATMPRESVDLCVYSPPFSSIYAYTSLPNDLGNAEDFKSEIPLHFSFFFRALLPVIKPGRVMILHCQNIVRMKRSGETGMYDFRGLLIRLALLQASFTNTTGSSGKILNRKPLERNPEIYSLRDWKLTEQIPEAQWATISLNSPLPARIK